MAAGETKEVREDLCLLVREMAVLKARLRRVVTMVIMGTRRVGEVGMDLAMEDSQVLRGRVRRQLGLILLTKTSSDEAAKG